MPIIKQQEKIILLFLFYSAIIGSVIGIFRHNLSTNPNILFSSKNLPEVLNKSVEGKIITDHNTNILKRNEVEHVTSNIDDKFQLRDVNIAIAENPTIVTEKNVINKSESNKKSVTENTSGLININIASKEDFMKLPYIGEV